MLRNIFGNLNVVTKNLLIINVLFFLAKIVFENKGVNMNAILAMHYPDSTLFYPHQIISCFFMHGSISHLLLNMIGVVLVGNHLEAYWGSKRYLIFYVLCAIGGTVCSTLYHGFEMYQIAGTFFPNIDVNVEMFSTPQGFMYSYQLTDLKGYTEVQIGQIMDLYMGSELGASGALFGVLMAFALLFPNTEFMLLFPPIPIKAKWLALILGVGSLYAGFTGAIPGIGHFAHLGGMLFGYLIIKYWQKDRSKFY